MQKDTKKSTGAAYLASEATETNPEGRVRTKYTLSICMVHMAPASSESGCSVGPALATPPSSAGDRLQEC